MIVIDYQNRKPIYEQVVERFQRLILTGAMEPDTQMPSVRALATELAINPNTIQKAYTILEQKGFIYPCKRQRKFCIGESGFKGTGANRFFSKTWNHLYRKEKSWEFPKNFAYRKQQSSMRRAEHDKNREVV